VLWRCWLGGRKGIRPVENWAVGCWRGYLSGARCRLKCIWSSGCHCHSLSLASGKSRLVLPFWYRLTRVVPDKGPLKGCVCVYLLTYLLTDRRRQFTLCIRHRQSVRVADALCRCRMARRSLQSRSDTSPRAQRQPARPCPVSATNCPSLAIIAKFHYTDPTGPARTFLRRNSVGSVRVADKVRAGPVGSV